MQNRNHFLADAAKLFSSAGELIGASKAEADDFIRLRLQQLLNDMELVQRDEFEAVKEMAIKALKENESLKKELQTYKKKKNA